MKSFKILAILLFSSFLFLNSCKDSSKTSKTDNSTTTETVDPATNSTTTTSTAATAEPAQNASGVWHYTCRIGCPGGAGSATKCTNCGNILAHNTAYHGNTTNTSNAPFANPSAAPTTAPTTAPATPEPAQNSAGVWHYTCANGCVGGAGAAGTCGTCSGALAHNSAYHQ